MINTFKDGRAIIGNVDFRICPTENTYKSTQYMYTATRNGCGMHRLKNILNHALKLAYSFNT